MSLSVCAPFSCSPATMTTATAQNRPRREANSPPTSAASSTARAACPLG